MPRESLKKASPSAVSNTDLESFEGSTLNRKFNPSVALGKVRARISQIIISKNNTGIKIFVTFSIPFFIPAMRIADTIINTKACHNMG